MELLSCLGDVGPFGVFWPLTKSTPDTFNESVSSLVERAVRGWLSGVLGDMRRHSPVQQWLDSLPGDVVPAASDAGNVGEDIDESKEAADVVEASACAVEAGSSIEAAGLHDTWQRKPTDGAGVGGGAVGEAGTGAGGAGAASSPRTASLRRRLQRDHSLHSEGYSPKQKNPLLRDYSLQSDGSGSSGSSVMNVLGARRVDAESLLLALGFGPSERRQQHQRIPERFLVPSKLKGISTEQFIKNEQRSMRMHDCGVFGYRGLTGSPHVPPSMIVAKIMERISQGDLFRDPEQSDSLPGSPHAQRYADT